VRVRERNIGGGKKVWIAEPDDLEKINVSDPEKIDQTRRITHLFSAEIGGANSFEPLVLGAELGLPVLDADGMGRAFPELQMFSPLIYGCRPYPSTVADNKGEVIACTYVAGGKDLEDFFRVECVRMGMSCGISLCVLTLEEVLNKAIPLTMSMAWQLGRAVRRAQKCHTSVLEAISAQQNGTVLLVGKVTDVVHVTQGGFGRLEAMVEGLDIYRGHKVKVSAKNENFIVRYMEEEAEGEGAVMACTPDLICLVDSDTGFPITTEAVRYGLRVGVLALPASPRMLTPRAMEVVGPAAFGLTDVSYHPPRSLLQIGKTLLADE
jgi:DUF917 family protein